MRLNRHPQDILVSRLYAANQENVRDHFLRLDFGLRRARFCGAASDDGHVGSIQAKRYGVSADLRGYTVSVPAPPKDAVPDGPVFRGWPQSKCHHPDFIFAEIIDWVSESPAQLQYQISNFREKCS